MRVLVEVKPNAKEEKIEERDGKLVVWVKEKPEKGKANLAVVKLLSKHFSRPVKIVKGFSARKKIVEVL